MYTANESAEPNANESGTVAIATKLKVVFTKIECAWKGNGKDAALTAGLELGKAVASEIVSAEMAGNLLRELFVARKVDEQHWGSVDAAFQGSMSLPFTKDYLLGEYFPAHANDNEESEQELTSNTALSDLVNPGGVVSDIVDWIVSSASRPSRELALSAVLPFVGALIGRRFASPTDLRTNFYSVALASSGYGKDHARTQLKRLITAAGLDRFSGPNRFMSASALRVAVMAKPSCVCMVDEFGGMMRQINDPRAGIHSQLIRSDLLEMFSSADTFFQGAAYAGSATPDKLHNPNLCLYGTSTPDDFWRSVTSLNSADGLLPRFLLFNVTGPKPDRVEASRTVYDVPDSLVESCRALVFAGRGVGNLASTDNGSLPTKPTIVQYSEEAKDELARFEASIEEREALATTRSLPILNRAVEHALKLALTVSVATDWETPVMTGRAMKWAMELAWLSTCTMIEETRDRIADNPREADLQRILGHIKNARKDGITEGTIADRCRSIDRKRRDELLADLMLAGRIETRETPTKGRPKKRYFLL